MDPRKDFTMRPLRWGIVTTGLISNDFCIALSTLPSSEHVVFAVGARSLEKAEQFAKEHGIEKSFGSYEELINHPKVDVIYIGSIHPLHRPHARLALCAGKPVLCEKPLCINSRETRELLSFAKDKRCFLMEALWVRHFPIYDDLQRLLVNEKVIGEPKNLIMSFGIPIGTKDSCALPALGGGSTLGIGIYCVQLALFVFGQEKPEIVQATGCLNDHGADEATSVTLRFSGKRLATFTTSYVTTMPNEAIIVGTHGSIKMHAPFLATTKLEISTTEDNATRFIERSLPVSKKTPILENSTGLQYQCQEVRRCLLEGQLESPKVSHTESQLIADICEQIRKQVGVVYKED